jgi:hypothetical protein
MSEAPFSIPLEHHLYTSTEGYKTVYASQSLSKETIQKLEEFTDNFCQTNHFTTRSSQFMLDHHFCFLSVRRLGTDHAGRPRSCAHTTLFPRQLFVTTPGLNLLFGRESLFARSWDGLDPLIRGLIREVPADQLTLTNPEEFLDNFQPPDDRLLSFILGGFIFPNRSSVLIGDVKENLRLLSRIALLIPRLTRIMTSLYVGVHWSNPPDSSQNRFFFLESGEARDYAVGGVAVCDTTKQQFFNAPSAEGHPFIEFLIRLCQRWHSSDSLMRLLRFQEADPSYQSRNAEQYFHYVKGLQFAEPFINEDGQLAEFENLVKQPQNVRALTNCLIHLYRAGSRNKSLEILQRILEALVLNFKKWKAKAIIEDELMVWTEQLTDEESDTFMRSMGMCLNESSEFPAIGFSNLEDGTGPN